MLALKIVPLMLLCSLFSPALFADESAAPGNAAIEQPGKVAVDEGIRFSCQPEQLAAIEAAMDRYLSSLGIGPELVVKKIDLAHGAVVYTLNTPDNQFSTLDLAERPELKIHDDIVSVPAKYGKHRSIPVVSKKEIVLALLQHGRLTEFKGRACNIAALQDHVGIRQNTVAWAENLNWVWPDGDYARWNNKYWQRGTPRPGVPLHKALSDVFLNQERYSFGCYTATKLVMMRGTLDYYRRIRKDPARLQLVENLLSIDNDPLVNIEPAAMWSFEKSLNPQERNRPGKLLKISHRIAPRNFVPGDWIYLLNTDPVSYNKTGYEGSNAIYLGRNRFDDYYNDNNHSYTYQQKIDEVYQWRNGVFSRSRDFAKIKPLTAQDIEQLSRTPAEGGILTDMRAFPYFFGYEKVEF